MAYKILPGVRTDHKGRRYQIAVYPNGKGIMVPYSETPGAEKHVPVISVETEKPRRILRTKQGAVKWPYEAYVRWRDAGQAEVFEDFGPTSVIQAFVDTDLRPLCISPDCGQTWRLLESIAVDHFVQGFKLKEEQQ